MSHLDPEQLALIALGEEPDTDESAHLDTCDHCTGELLAFAHTVAVGRSTVGLGTLEAPPERVWERIAADVAALEDAGQSVGADKVVDGPGDGTADVESTAGGGTDDAAEAAATSRPRRRRLTRLMVALAASAALVLAVVGTWAVVRPAPTTEIAAATLDAFPGHPGASGEAIVVENSDGERVVRVSLEDGADGGGFREVWLITADATALVSLGVLEGTEGDFTIPAAIDITEYVLVDISLEPVDGDPAHSGDSIVRGELDFA